MPNEFHWPPIYRRSCDSLFCVNPPCFARVKRFKCQCVLVYKLINGILFKIGYRTRCYIDHMKCGCKECKDISNRFQCVTTMPCPNANSTSFCYWKPYPGKCDCCEPLSCPYLKIFNNNTCSCACPDVTCPFGLISNPDTCECECPPGSIPFGNKCIGE